MKKLLIAVLSWMCATAGAFAFPSWIGVYGGEVRHTDSTNPGTYTILLNQDYTGLHAEVGVQVNNGAWTVYQMTYAGTKDTNSKWTHTPASGYPAGATVRYYFHGWDDWGGNTWDNANGANYSFTVAANTTTIQFSSAQPIGANSPGIESGATLGDTNFVCLVEGGTQFRAARRISNGLWTNITTLDSATGLNDSGIAANPSTVVVVAGVGSQLRIYRSTDQGQSYGTPQVINLLTGGLPVVELDVATGSGSKFVIACVTGFTANNPQVWFLQSTDNGATWSTPVSVDATFALFNVRVGANDEGNFLAYVRAGGQRSSTFRVAFSANGQTWAGQDLYEVLGGTAAGVPALLVNSSRALAALDQNSQIAFWARSGGTWQQRAAISDVGSSAQALALVEPTAGTLVAVRQFVANSLAQAKYWISSDAGTSWGASGPVTEFSDSRSLVKAIGTAGKVHLLWHQFQQPSTHATLWQTGTLTTGGPVLQWVGNTYTYPANGTVTSTDDLWINAETWQIAPGQSVSLSYRVYANGIFESKPMDWSYNDANNSHWHVNLGKLPAGMIVEYFVVARQGDTTLYDNNNGQNYSVTIAAAPVQWAGNVYNWPANGQIKSTDDFWVNIESWPAGTATSGRVVYSTDGVNWFSVDLTRTGTTGSNDAWHANLGKFASRKTIQYAIEVKDGTNKSMWANNNGANYRATVN